MYNQLLERLNSNSKSNPCELTFINQSEWNELEDYEQILLSYTLYNYAIIED